MNKSANQLGGPYKLEKRHHVWAISDDNGREIAYVDRVPVVIDGQPAGSVTSRGFTEEQLAMRARAFTAAPELVSAIEGALRTNCLWPAGESSAHQQMLSQEVKERFEELIRFVRGA